MSTHSAEVLAGRRFEFGANWSLFIRRLTPERIQEAEESLKNMLGVESLRGARFLDIGSGSGLFSLAARRLGAAVHSFDVDPQSVACTQELRQRFFENDSAWRVEEGSALDAAYLQKLGLFDVVYSWGVLHHTSDMWSAINNAMRRVAPGGRLFISLYNDQGAQSRRWTLKKRIYNKLPRGLRSLYIALVMGPRELKLLAGAILRGRFVDHVRKRLPSAMYSRRGMSYWRDMVDWMGGYPFEVAKPEEVFRFMRDRGFRMTEMTTCGGGHGCNQFVFVREDRVGG
jgi:2-polyprenyl-3-methyl-5-hydroxy-6-metoxy-1,4-benzoquinol methylase